MCVYIYIYTHIHIHTTCLMAASSWPGSSGKPDHEAAGVRGAPLLMMFNRLPVAASRIRKRCG